MSEAVVHFELYRYPENAIESDPTRESTTFDTVVPEYATETRRYADLVVFDDADDPVIVVEAKRPDGDSGRSRTGPYAPSVINQAAQYATEIGAPYFTRTPPRTATTSTWLRCTVLQEITVEKHHVG